VLLLRRHRTDGQHRPLREAAAGPLAGWLTEHVPSLAGGRRAVLPPDPAPHLAAVPPELVAVAGGSPGEVAAAVRARVQFHGRSPAERAPLVAYLAHVPPAALAETAEALGALPADAATTMLAAYLADLATTRNQMLLGLAPPAPDAASPDGGAP
jgi:hypothetical protein